MNRLTRDLLITTRRPARIVIATNLIADVIMIDGRHAEDRLCLWPSLADVLFNTETRECVGLVHFFTEREEKIVHSLLETTERVVIRHPVAPAYLQGDAVSRAFEIRWSDAPATEWDVVQEIASWYYPRGSRSDSAELLAYGIEDVDGLLDTYELKMPSVFCAPVICVYGTSGDQGSGST